MRLKHDTCIIKGTLAEKQFMYSTIMRAIKVSYKF